MEVNNRFELLASLPADGEPIEYLSIDVTTTEQRENIDDGNSTTSQWEIPEYVEKSIPTSVVLTTKVKKTSPVKKVKPSVDIIKCDEQHDEVETSPTVEVQNQPTSYSYYPPRPYKFKQTPANHVNQSIPKFNRKMNGLPKHTSTRGNSKASTHQI